MRNAIVIAVFLAIWTSHVASQGNTCSPCTASQCSTTPCIGPADPFYCYSGRSAGGCAPTATAWNNSQFCTGCCDASSCKPTFQCSATCSVSSCQSPSRCPAASPYMCTSGNSTNGCSADRDAWPTSRTCSACCDARSCIKPCTACTPAQCQANRCNNMTKYMCTGGLLNGWCSADSQYFPNQPACYGCCDVTTCPP
eukprot:PhF_6_TR18559/c0_g1_i1/m.27109